MQIIKRLIVVACCICSFEAYAEGSSGGLLFTSSKEKVDKRTSLVLFGDKLQKFENTFSVSFDLSIWDISQFGHIFRVINKQRQEVEFVFVNFYGTDNMYLDFHSPITHESVQIPITKEDIDKKVTLHFDMKFNLTQDKVTIKLRNKEYTCAPVGLENPTFLQFAFGLYGLNLDVPQMLIRNLRIKGGKGKSFFFPLEEPEGDYAYDKIEKVKARVKNPEWIINKHFYWQKKTEFTVKNKACVTYDEANNRILIVNNDAIISYYPRYEKSENHSFGTLPSDFKVNDAIYDPYSQQSYVFNAKWTSKPEIKLNDLSVAFLSDLDERNFLHHNSFFSTTGDIYQFGGYANHSYYDKVSHYNVAIQQWEFVDFKGDRITPRFYSAVGDGLQPDEKLLFGGFGNETGKQEHGGHNLYDLHVLNLTKKTITRLWRLHDLPKMEFIPGNNLILSKDKKSFYALCYAHHIPKTTGYLYRFNLKDGSYDIMSDSINFTSEDMNTSVNLFYNKQMSEFYAVIREFSEKSKENKVQIYSLLSPPITKSYLEASMRSHRSYWWMLIAAVCLIVFASGAFALWYFYNKRKKEIRLKAQSDAIHLPLEEAYNRKIQKLSAVYVFGNFTVYDRKGMDISYRFSMKLRALFSLVLLNSNGESGISTENLTLTLWPDKDVNGAKNIRGVTINRLRNILEDIEGISLVHQNHQWFFVFEQPFYCDYLEYSNVLRSLQHSSGQESYLTHMEEIVAIVRNGAFLLSVHDPGVDNYKSKEEEKLGQLLKDYIIYLFADKQYQKIILISSTFFAVEALNEEILDVCIKSYNKLGKKEEAKSFLKNYKRTHKMLTGEEYKGGDVSSSGKD
jgi:two-component SAPR family response regulator